MFEAKIWGSHYWFVLMTIALTYPNYPNSTTKRKYYDFIQNLPLFIPIDDMGDKFSEILDRYPVSPYLDSRESFTRWIHFIHNKINVMTGREEISYGEALERYFAEYRPKPVYLSDKIRVQRYYIYMTFLFLCFLVILIYCE